MGSGSEFAIVVGGRACSGDHRAAPVHPAFPLFTKLLDETTSPATPPLADFPEISAHLQKLTRACAQQNPCYVVM